MKAKLIIDGKEFEVDISDDVMKTILPKFKTGYERVDSQQHYYYACPDNGVFETYDVYDIPDNSLYDGGNYYSDKTIAENNSRADKLMRQLRRFAVEQRCVQPNWRSCSQDKYCIYFDYGMQSLLVKINNSSRTFGAIYFDSERAAKLAIDTFREELTWYFMEYKDSL